MQDNGFLVRRFFCSASVATPEGEKSVRPGNADEEQSRGDAGCQLRRVHLVEEDFFFERHGAIAAGSLKLGLFILGETG